MNSNISELIKKVNPTVVKVQIKTQNGKILDSGTGVSIGPNMIATCYHVIDPDLCGNPHNPIVNGNNCTIKKINRNADLAVLKINEKIPYVDFIPYQQTLIGGEIIFSGYPAGVSNLTCHKGMISSKGEGLLKEYTGINMIQIDGTINLGNSGGPVFDVETGKLIGIVTAKYAPFFDGVEEFRKVIKNIEQQPSGELGLGKIDFGKYVNFVFKGFATLINPLILVQIGIGYVIPTDYLSDLMD